MEKQIGIFLSKINKFKFNLKKKKTFQLGKGKQIFILGTPLWLRDGEWIEGGLTRDEEVH